MNGKGLPALEIFQQLQKLNIELNSIIFIGVLTACCHAGLVERGEEYFKSTNSVYNIHPDIKHYGCMVDLYGRAEKLGATVSFIKSMPMKPDVVIWGEVLAASKTHGNLEIGEVAAKCLAKLDTSIFRGNCNCRVCLQKDVDIVAGLKELGTSGKLQKLLYLLHKSLPLFWHIQDEQSFEMTIERRVGGTQFTEDEIRISILEEDDRVYWFVTELNKSTLAGSSSCVLGYPLLGSRIEKVLTPENY